MGTKEYGRKELERVGYFKEGDDPYNEAVANAILELLEVFDNQGHSGFSAPYTARMFHRLAMFKPITPLTGEDSEWNEVGTGVYQNKRYSAVFKDRKDGKAYNIEGKIFSDDGGEVWFTNRDSKVYIEFPYIVPDHPEKIILNKEPKIGHCRDCKQWRDHDGLFRRGVGAESKCPINRKEVFEGNGYCYMFEPRKKE